MQVNMQLSDKGRQLLQKREGCRLHVYKDVVGLETIGYGHLIKIGEHFTTITQAEADALFAKDLQRFVDNVNNNVKVSITQDQFDALVSFSFNIGVAGFNNSTALKLINNGKIDDGGRALMNWLKPAVLFGRRSSELKQFQGKI